MENQWQTRQDALKQCHAAANGAEMEYKVLQNKIEKTERELNEIKLALEAFST